MNWYKMAKYSAKLNQKPQSPKPNKQPYKLIKIMDNEEQELSEKLKQAYVEAFSKDQAKILFLKKYPELYDFIGVGGDIEVILDIDRINERKKTEENRKSRYDEIVQDAWWNK